MYKHYRFILIGILLLGVAAAFMLFQGCKKQDKSPSASTENSAKLFEYVGVIVGSSGHYKVEVDTNGATAFVMFDNEEHRLSVYKKIEKDKDIDSLVMKDDVVTIIYSYKYATQTPYITITIKGHDVEYTVSTLYDHRHPQYVQDNIRLYEGSFHTTIDERLGTYNDGVMNVSLDKEAHTFKAISKLTGSSDPNEIGMVIHSMGTYTENNETLTVKATGENEGVEFRKVGNDLKYEESIGTYVYLNYVSF